MLATDIWGPNASARAFLVDSHWGINPEYPEVLGLVPTEFQWYWKRGFYSSLRRNATAVDLITKSGFRLTWKRTRKLPKDTFIVLGVGADSWPSSLGYFVMGYGQYGFPYIDEPGEEKDPDDREYCRPVGRSRVVCEVGPVLYSEPNPYPWEPRVVISAPRFVFAQVYTWGRP